MFHWKSDDTDAAIQVHVLPIMARDILKAAKSASNAVSVHKVRISDDAMYHDPHLCRACFFLNGHSCRNTLSSPPESGNVFVAYCPFRPIAPLVSHWTLNIVFPPPEVFRPCLMMTPLLPRPVTLLTTPTGNGMLEETTLGLALWTKRMLSAYLLSVARLHQKMISCRLAKRDKNSWLLSSRKEKNVVWPLFLRKTERASKTF